MVINEFGAKISHMLEIHDASGLDGKQNNQQLTWFIKIVVDFVVFEHRVCVFHFIIEWPVFIYLHR